MPAVAASQRDVRQRRPDCRRKADRLAVLDKRKNDRQHARIRRVDLCLLLAHGRAVFVSGTFTVLNVDSRSCLKVSRGASGAASTVQPDAGTALSSLPCANAAAGTSATAAAVAGASSCLRVRVFMFLCILTVEIGVA